MIRQDERTASKSESKGNTKSEEKLRFTVVSTTRTTEGDTQETTPLTTIRGVVAKTLSESEVKYGHLERNEHPEKLFIRASDSRDNSASNNETVEKHVRDIRQTTQIIRTRTGLLAERSHLQKRLRHMLRLTWGDYEDWGEVARTKARIAELEGE